MRNTKNHFLYTMLTIALVLSGCGTGPVTSLSKEIKEIRPDILEGYLEAKELPNSLLLLPPPPEEGSAAHKLDLEIAALYLASEDEARREQAAKDEVNALLAE